MNGPALCEARLGGVRRESQGKGGSPDGAEQGVLRFLFGGQSCRVIVVEEFGDAPFVDDVLVRVHGDLGPAGQTRGRVFEPEDGGETKFSRAARGRAANPTAVEKDGSGPAEETEPLPRWRDRRPPARIPPAFLPARGRSRG